VTKSPPVGGFVTQAPPRRDNAEKLRYGGFVARIYFDGKLQAERSEPRELVAALRNNSRTSPPPIAATSPSPTPRPSAEKALPSVAPAPVQANRDATSELPYASPVPDKPGFVYSPYNPKYLIDVRGFPPGTQVTDPNSGKVFRVP